MATGELAAEEGTLVARASRGDRDAMAELYNRHFDGVYDFVRRTMRDADEAADVVQDVFLKAMTAIGSLKKGERFRSWLFSIAHNTALNRLEKQKRISRPPVGEEEEGEASRIYQQVDTDRLADPQAALVDQETASLVWEAAAGLDRRQYALLDLHVRQGLDSAEIAQVMGVSKGNAYTMVSRLKSAVEESITAYLMARRGRKECPVLNDILADQEIAGMTPELRRLVNRHVSECPTCQRTKKRIVSPVSILGAFAAVPAPLGLKESIFQNISAAAGGPPSGDGGTGGASGRSDLLVGARAGVQRMATGGAKALRGLPRNRLALLLIAGLMGVGGAVIVGMLALFGAFSGDGDSAVLGALSTPTRSPTANARVTAGPSDEATPTPTSTPVATATATVASSISQPPSGSGADAGSDEPVPAVEPPPPEEPVSPEEPTSPGETPSPEQPTPTVGPAPTATPAPPPTPTATPAPTPTPVPPMTIVWFDVNPGNCDILLDWNVTGDPAGTVELWRKESSGIWSNIYTSTVGTGDYTDAVYGNWTYILVARNSLDESTTSNEEPVTAPCIQ